MASQAARKSAASGVFQQLFVIHLPPEGKDFSGGCTKPIFLAIMDGMILIIEKPKPALGRMVEKDMLAMV